MRIFLLSAALLLACGCGQLPVSLGSADLVEIADSGSEAPDAGDVDAGESVIDDAGVVVEPTDAGSCPKKCHPHEHKNGEGHGKGHCDC